MTFIEKLKEIFNRDIEYVDVYREDLAPAAAKSGAVDAGDITDEEKAVIAVTVAALAAGDAQNADFRIKSIKRVS